MQTADDSMDLDLQPRFEAYWRKVELLIFSLLALLVVAALAGYVGGARSNVKTGIGNRAVVEYMKTIPYKGTSAVTITLNSLISEDVQISLSDNFYQQMGIKDIQPKPSEKFASPGWHNMKFKLLPVTGGETGSKITLSVQPIKIGRVFYRIAVDGLPVETNHFILP